MKVYTLYRKDLNSNRNLHHSWFDQYVFLQEKDAKERAEELFKNHQDYCKRFGVKPYLEFGYVELELMGSWIDI